MRSLLAIVRCLGLAALVLSPGLAAAQEAPALKYTAGFDPEQFEASADPDQIGVVDGARTQTRGSLGVGLLFHFAGPALSICIRDTGSTNPACQVEGDILSTRLRADLAVLYGLGRFDVRLLLPSVLHQTTDFDPTSMDAEALGSAGVGSPKLGVRFQIARPGPMDIAADLGVSIPVGTGNFIGDKGLLVEPRLLFDLRMDRVELGINLGYRYRQKSAELADLYVDDEVTWSAAAQYWLTPHRLAVGAAAYGRIGIMDAPDVPSDGSINELGPEERPAEVMGSVRYFINDTIALDVGGGTALTGGYGAVPYRVLTGLSWINQKGGPRDRRLAGAPAIKDRDQDGVADADDKCPKTLEDRDGYEDTDGCPEADNDGDGVNDTADACPLVAEDVDTFEDEDGCPEPDNDGDGIGDADDDCPLSAEDGVGTRNADGCPSVDEDGDGVGDSLDKCPTALEDLDGVADDDGCPETDADSDKIADTLDECPTQAEDLDRLEDDDGCPETDADDDGLKDAEDKCPLEAEIFNDLKDDDGCPDEGAALAIVVPDPVKPGVDLDGDGKPDKVVPGKPDKVVPGKPDKVVPGKPDKIVVPGKPTGDADRKPDLDGDGKPDVDADGDGKPDKVVPGKPDKVVPGKPDKVVKPVKPDKVVKPVKPDVDTDTDTDVDDDTDGPGPDVDLDRVGVIVITQKIFFDFNRARIKTRSQPVLNAVTAILKAHSDVRIRIDGHTDERGSRGWNRKLSQMRAERVRDYFIGKGIAADRLEAQGFGSSRPLVRGDTETARDKNRRVEFVITGYTGPGPDADKIDQ